VSGAPDLAVVVVSHADAAWLPACLRSLAARAGELRLEVVVVENGPGEETEALLARDFPGVRAIRTENRGFAHGSNVGLLACPDARYALLLNPDTEVLEGELAALVRWLDEHPGVGAAGVRQVDGEGRLLFTIRRFPSPLRALGEALGAERLPFARAPLTERELDPRAYERVTECDWTVGSFLLLRRDALLAAGLLDERLFLYSDEPDLCLRIRRAGWRVVHLPLVTIAHHHRPARSSERGEAQAAVSRAIYARKHLAPPARAAFLAAVCLRHALRALAPGPPGRRAAARAALATLLGRREPPFAAPPPVALAPRAPESTPHDG
jgi:N-acetylglucosaminyl-diphospho-decaprenol L-rhamnosyltransferase